VFYQQRDGQAELSGYTAKQFTRNCAQCGQRNTGKLISINVFYQAA